jgi:3-hydroxybutyryl-CoA dehydrogenase
MPGEKIQKIAVVGAGLMGHGIAQEFAAAGYQVKMHDLTDDALHQAQQRIEGNLRMLQEAELVSAEQSRQALDNLNTSTKLDEVVGDADLVIEAIAEKLEVKQQIFRRCDEWCPSHAILASNTSTFMPSKLAQVTGRADKVLVTHYFNPPFLMPLVEIVRSAATSETTIKTVYELLAGIGKSPVVVQKEVPGFIGNRIQAAALREALALVEEGVATPQEVDTVIKTSIGRRWAVAGVFEIAEIAGLDLKLAIVEQLFPEIASTQEVSHLLRDKVAQGDLGFKTGKGFYEWPPETAEALRQRVAQALIEIARW